MFDSFIAKKEARRGDILSALKRSHFSNIEILARAGLYGSILESKDASVYYEALSRSQFGEIEETIELLNSLSLEKYSKISPSLRLPIIQKLAAVDRVSAYKFAQVLTPDFPDFIKLLGEAGDYDDLLLKVNELLQNPEEAERCWQDFFKQHQCECPPFPIQGKRLELSELEGFQVESTPKNRGLVSVIVSAYNAADVINISLQSLLNQSYDALEIIVVDDASTDTTFAKVEKIFSNYSRHKVLRMEENQGSYAARNLALKHAKGSYIMNHDADDWAHPMKVEKLLDGIASGDYMAATSRWLKIGDASGKLETNYFYPLLRHCTNSILFRSEILNKIDGYEFVRVAADERFEMEIKAYFGYKSICNTKLPLTIATHSDSTLTGGSMGVINKNGLAKRINYRERWMRELIANALS